MECCTLELLPTPFFLLPSTTSGTHQGLLILLRYHMLMRSDGLSLITYYYYYYYLRLLLRHLINLYWSIYIFANNKISLSLWLNNNPKPEYIKIILNMNPLIGSGFIYLSPSALLHEEGLESFVGNWQSHPWKAPCTLDASSF